MYRLKQLSNFSGICPRSREPLPTLRVESATQSVATVRSTQSVDEGRCVSWLFAVAAVRLSYVQ